ncbi:hypothetical protein ABMA27_014929 [Loxostege sticticalis]|uniref:Uncharacterized protein n=1 Tax=Loxostege sticticalis TaxID=481309 RepID=A0ABR3IAP4_LOXSC
MNSEESRNENRTKNMSSESSAVHTNKNNEKCARRSKRRRSPSSSSSSSSSSSTSTSSSSISDSHQERKSRRHKKRGGKRKRQRERYRFHKLSQEVEELRKRVSFRDERSYPHLNFNDLNSDELIDDNISGDLYKNSDDDRSRKSDIPPESLVFGIETKLKEPSVPKTPQHYLATLNDIQHFESNDWCEVRYAETQKLYSHSPGFVELDINEEVKAYDSLRHLAHSERAYAALTFCVLKQREIIQTSLRNLLQWGRDSSFRCEDLEEKVNDFFLKGDLPKVSSDLLQLVCGHRAETIQMRRDGITNYIRDPLVKAAVRKVPPDCQHIFKAESLAAVLEKAGGVKKALLPLNKSLNTHASQAGSSKAEYRPPQGQVYRNVPSQGISTGCCAPLHIPHTHQPSQGCGQICPSQGQWNNNAAFHHAPSQNYRGASRPRGGRQGRQGHVRPKEFSNNKGNQSRTRSSSQGNSRGGKPLRYPGGDFTIGHFWTFSTQCPKFQ